MTFWSAIVTIVLVVCVTAVIRSYLDARTARGDDRETLENRIDELESELSERVQTLERIITDERSQLHRQFDDLEKSA